MRSKTLDQYTRAERAQMVGMWCDHDDKGRIKQSVITNIVDVRSDYGLMRQVASLYWPEQKHWHVNGEELATVTPRFDLLRAWTPDGKPVPSQAEWSTVDRSTSPANQWKGLRFSAGSEEHARTSAHSFGYDVERRFITDWEEQGMSGMTPQIIRTAEELHALDPEAILTDKHCDVMSAEVWYDNADFPQNETDNLAVIATGEQVRAARQALEKEQA